MSQSKKKLLWSPEEDKLLKETVESRLTDVLKFNGDFAIGSTWGDIATRLPHRTAKQCRERWCYNLSPNIKRDVWTVKEDTILMTLQTTQGNQWALIARQLTGRTENAVKTRYKSIIRALKRSWSTAEDEKLRRLQQRFGSCRWGDVAKYLHGRTPNAAKARYRWLRKGMHEKELELGDPLQMFHQSTSKGEDGTTGKRKRQPSQAHKKLIEAIERNLADPQHMKSIGVDWKQPHQKRTKLVLPPAKVKSAKPKPGANPKENTKTGTEGSKSKGEQELPKGQPVMQHHPLPQHYPVHPQPPYHQPQMHPPNYATYMPVPHGQPMYVAQYSPYMQQQPVQPAVYAQPPPYQYQGPPPMVQQPQHPYNYTNVWPMQPVYAAPHPGPVCGYAPGPAPASPVVADTAKPSP